MEQVVVNWAQAAADAATDPWSALIGLGPVGIILLLFVLGKIRTEAEVTRLEKRNDELTKQLAEVAKVLMEQVIPAQAKSTLVLERLYEERR
jgi:hypothetical protein